jgi:hypothetical protein
VQVGKTRVAQRTICDRPSLRSVDARVRPTKQSRLSGGTQRLFVVQSISAAEADGHSCFAPGEAEARRGTSCCVAIQEAW